MIVTHTELPEIRQELEGLRVALRFGTYDILHAGHQEGIDYAAEMADRVVLGVMPDSYVSRFKGPDRPIYPDHVRAARIDGAHGADFTFVAPDSRLALLGVIARLRPDVYVEDQEYGASRVKHGLLAILGVEYQIDRRARAGSSSAIIAAHGIAGAMARAGLDYRLS